MESGSCDSQLFFREYAKAVSFSEHYAAAVGCAPSANQLTCLRALSTGQVMSGGVMKRAAAAAAAAAAGGSYTPFLSPIMPWAAAIDGDSRGLLDVPLALIRQKRWARVPFILGTNENEGTLFVPAIPFIVPGVFFPLDRAGLRMTLAHFFNASTVSSLLTAYKHYKSSDDIANHVLTQFMFTCAARRVAEAMYVQGFTDIYLYQFDYKPRWIDYEILGDYHTTELEFVFANAWPPFVHAFNKTDYVMAHTMGAYWTNHAASGSPNKGPSAVHTHWAPYNSTAYNTNYLNVPSAVAPDRWLSICAMWNKIEVKK